VKGPVPTGLRSAFSGVPAFNMASAYSLDWIEANAIARSARNGASGWLSVNLTVLSSTFSTLLMMSGMPMSLKYS